MTTSSNNLPGYEIGREIARTDRAIVYRAVNELTQEVVAAKLVRNDECGHQEIAMLREVADANPRGPVHVMRLIDYWEDNDDLWLQLEYFDSTLEDIDHEFMTPLALMSISVDSSKGLVEMYRADVIDDDVKPANIAFKARSGRVAHLDLGCARLKGERPTGYTVEYAAPEVALGRASETSPCYSWARSMEYITTGTVGLGPDYLISDRVPWVSLDFAKLIARCCESNPGKRPSINSLYRKLRGIIGARDRCENCNAVKFANASCPTC